MPNEITVVATRSTGAKIERKRSIRITRITTSTTGMIRLRSWMEASLVSIAVAVVPPTSPTPANSARRLRTVCSAAAESAASVNVVCSSTSPLTTVGSGAGDPGGPTAVMPSAVMGALPLGESAAVTATDPTPDDSRRVLTASCSFSWGTTT